MKHFKPIIVIALCCAGFACEALTIINGQSGEFDEDEISNKSAEKKSEAVWLTDLAAAKKQAAAEKKPILMFFTGSDWCGWCKKLHEDVLDKDEFQTFAKENLILLELDFPNSIPQSNALKKQNKALGEKFKVSGYPTMVLVASDGETEIDRNVGYSKELVGKLKTALKKGSAAKKTDAKAPAQNKTDNAWLTDFEEAKKRAAAEKKPILMFFTGSDWCGWCIKLHEDVLDKDEFQKFAKENLILLELDFPNSIPQSDALKKQNRALDEKFKVEGYPTMVLVEADGEKELGRTVGYTKDLVKELKKALNKDAADAKKKSGEETSDEAGEKLAWLTDFEAAKKQAAAEKKPILMFFTGSDWCIWCQRLHEDVLDEDEFKEFSKKLILLELDFPQEKELPESLKKQNAELAKQFDVDGYPCTVVLEPDGKTELGRIPGYSLEYVGRIQDILDGKGRPVTMDELNKQFAYLPDMLVEYEDLKLTKEDLLKEIFEEKPSVGDCARIKPENIADMIRGNLDNAIMLYLAQKAGFKPSRQLVMDSVMKELDDLPDDERKMLEDGLKAQGITLEEQIGKIAEREAVQKQTAIQLFVNQHAENAAKKEITDDDVREFYNANRTQFPGSFDDEKATALDILVKARAPEKTDELDKEVEAIRKTVKYWQPEK